MAYLDEFLKNSKDLKKFMKNLMTTPAMYKYHSEHLFEKTMRIFEWDGLPFDQHHLETILETYGWAAITKVNGEIIVGSGSMFGPSKFYYDEYTNVIINTPSGSYQRVIGKDAFIIKNNSLRNSILPLINRYSVLMAHADVTLTNALVNGRANVAISTADETVAESVKQWMDDLYVGKQNYIADELIGEVKFNSLETKGISNLKDIIDTVQFLEDDFWKNLGVKNESHKRERLNLAEVQEDNTFMTLQIDDMLKTRQEGAEMFKTMFGIDVTVQSVVEHDHIEEEADIYEDETDE